MLTRVFRGGIAVSWLLGTVVPALQLTLRGDFPVESDSLIVVSLRSSTAAPSMTAWKWISVEVTSNASMVNFHDPTAVSGGLRVRALEPCKFKAKANVQLPDAITDGLSTSWN